jgi:hypothetical protein
MTLCTILSSAMLGLLSFIFNIEISEATSETSKSSMFLNFVVAIIIAPLLETLIYQYAVIKLLRKVKILKNNNYIIILICSILFGLSHTYSLSYVINTTIIGIILAYSFITYEKKGIPPFLIVCAIHSLRNLFSFVVI